MNYPQIKPTLNLDFSNTKTLDPRINFRRGTPGAYYDGKTYAKAEENLISFSEDFSNVSWAKLNVGAAANSILSPNAVDNSYTLTASASAGQHAIYVRYASPFLNETITLSAFVKAGTSSKVILSNVFSGESLSVDLSSQEIRTAGDILSYDITDVDNDWFRLSFTYLNDDSTWYDDNGLGVYILDDNWEINFTADGTETIHIWGAQLEQRDSVTAYTPTNGTPVTKYQPQLMFASPDQPRFDHDVLTGESKGLLIEESRTNLIEYSEDFDYVENIRSSYISNYITAPDGTITGVKLIDSTETGTHRGDYVVSIVSGNIYTYSVFVKQGEHHIYEASIGNTAVSDNYVEFNLNNGTYTEVGNASGDIENVGNGWYRCSITMPALEADRIASGIHSGTKSFTGDGYSGLYIWGAQLEEGSFATSYIKTSGASATRSADDASITGENFSSWYRQDEGSLYSEVNTLASSSYSRISMSDGTSSNRIFISNGIYPLYINKNGDVQVRESSSAIVNVYSKRAAGLKKNDFALSIDGGNPLVDTSGDLPFVDRLAFSTSHASDNYVNGHIKKLSYYPQRLTNEQLQQLTK